MQFESLKTTARNNKTAGSRNGITDWIVALIILFSFTTSVQSLVDIVSLNRIVGAIITILLMVLFCNHTQKRLFIKMAVLILIAITSLIFTRNLAKEINDLIYLFVTLLMMAVIPRNKQLFQKAIEKRTNIIIAVMTIECILLAVLLITRTGYSYNWGGSRYFRGLCNSQHTMASLCCLIISLLVYTSKKKGNYFSIGLLMLIPSYAVLETGARVFLFPLAILLFIYVLYAVRKRYLRILIYCFGIAVGGFIILHSTMAEKFSFVTGNLYASNFASAFTSGRAEFWKVDLDLFFSGNVFQLLLGRSFSDVYLTNLQQVNLDIWAHNDIIHLLVGMGIIGASLYISIIFNTLKSIKNNIDNRLLFTVLVLYIFIPLLLNGFFGYQHYVYSFMILYFIFLSGGKVDTKPVLQVEKDVICCFVADFNNRRSV